MEDQTGTELTRSLSCLFIYFQSSAWSFLLDRFPIYRNLTGIASLTQCEEDGRLVRFRPWPWHFSPLATTLHSHENLWKSCPMCKSYFLSMFAGLIGSSIVNYINYCSYILLIWMIKSFNNGMHLYLLINIKWPVWNFILYIGN